MSFVLGQTYCGYELLDILKMSKIELAYRVRNTVEQRTEVLRVLPRGAQDDQEQMERFVRETKVHAQLLHPNIVTFYKAMELERQLVMTTEYVEAATLAERLQGGPLPWRDALGFMCQALSALACAHAHGVVHRDLSPDNMVITPDGVLKLSNFALAKTHNSPQLTQAGAVVGNLKYISPEQVKGSAEIDARSDVYSLGAVLYEALTGKPPFFSKSHFELMLAHVNDTPKPPSSLNPDIPAELDVIVMKALAKDPAARHESAGAFRAALERLKAPPAAIPVAEVAEPAPNPPVVLEPAPPAPVAPPPATAPQLPAVPPPLQPANAETGAAMFASVTATGSDSNVLATVALSACGLAFLMLIAYLLAGR